MNKQTRNRRLPARVRRVIEFALKRAELKTCAADPEAQEKMRLYLNSWVASPLRQVLLWDDGDRSAYLSFKD